MAEQSKRVAIVTGASRGIGAAVAQRLSRDGFATIINYAGNAKDAETQVRIVTGEGGTALAVKADVSRAEDVAAMFEEAERRFGGVDVLVNNAGIMRLSKLQDADDQLFDAHVAVNLKGVFNCMREGAKRLRSGGRIVSFSSSVVGLYQPTYGIYAATKAGVEALTHVLAGELRGRNVTANVIAPGPTATELFLEGKGPEAIDHYAKLAPLERLGVPEDIAAVVSFLAGPDGAWVNGQVLRANGGII